MQISTVRLLLQNKQTNKLPNLEVDKQLAHNKTNNYVYGKFNKHPTKNVREENVSSTKMEPIWELYNIYKQDAQGIINSQQAFKEFSLDKDERVVSWLGLEQAKQQTTAIEDSFYYGSEENPDTTNSTTESQEILLISEWRIQKQEDLRMGTQEDESLKSCNTKSKMEDSESIKFDVRKNKIEGGSNSSEIATMCIGMEEASIKKDSGLDTKKAGAGVKGKIEVQPQPGVAQNPRWKKNKRLDQEPSVPHSHSVLPNKRLKIAHDVNAAEADNNDSLCATKDTNLWLLITELKEKLTSIEQQIGNNGTEIKKVKGPSFGTLRIKDKGETGNIDNKWRIIEECITKAANKCLPKVKRAADEENAKQNRSQLEKIGKLRNA
ncbi:1812_t:CDS:2, partial [Gigaspora rosea]